VRPHHRQRGRCKDPETGVRNVGWYRLTQLWNCKHPQGGTYTEGTEKAAVDLRLLESADEPYRPASAKAQRMRKPPVATLSCDPPCT
jgi:hypothetical protein